MSQQSIIMSVTLKGIGKVAALLFDQKEFTTFAGVRQEYDADVLRTWGE